MKTFLGQIPQRIPIEELSELDSSTSSAVRDVASGFGMPALNAASSILETYAAVLTAQMLHDGEDRAAYNKGVIQGLLIGADLPRICSEIVKKPTKEGSQP
jgi:uncharacterized membrane protein